ncbi:MAG: efflux RND transporter permease subunit [Verrucomicrobia bacterium]|nr:efflux RND transporter permease subunit [Verrucomicrobiota bacterium]
MNLSEPFIRRPVMTILVMASILFFGIAAYFSLPVSDLPSIDFPTIQVSVSYPGANPETMANAVTTPLEREFMTIPGIQNIFSTSNTGSSTIILQFELDRNIDGASTDVQAAISRAQPNLPSDLPYNPTYEKVNPASTPILYLAYTSSSMTMADLYDYANTFIGQRLSMVEGVSQVVTYGSPYAVRVQIDPEKLAAKNIGLDEVADVIQQANVDHPVGTLFGPRDDYTLNVDGQIFRAPGYAELVVKNEDGSLVKIKELGRALDSVKDDKFFQQYITRDKSEPSVILAIRRQPGENTVRIIQKINKTLGIINPQLPGSLKVYRIYDQSISIREAVNDVKMTLLIAFCLVVLIIFLLLGKAMNTIIPSLAIPISIFGTFALMFLIGFSIDILSLLALTLSIGFLVDDAIVVLENSVRHVQLGEKPFEAAIKGAKEISVTVLTMTLCLAAAFIPMVFMGGVIGRLFREFAITIVGAVLISGLISLTLTPMLSARFVKPYTQKTKMEEMAERLNEKLLAIYKPCLLWAMSHRVIMLGIGLFSIGASLLLLAVLPKDFLPPDDTGFIEGYTLARDGTSPFLMNDYHNEMSEKIRKNPNVESILSINSYNNANEGIFFIQLKPYHDRKPLNTIINDMTLELNNQPGLNVFLSPLPLINLQVGTTAQALYQYTITGLDQKTIYNYVPKLAAQLKRHPHFTQVSTDLRIQQPQWALEIQRDKAYDLNVNANQIEGYFTYAYSDLKISQINANINQYDVLLETLPRFYRDPTVLSKLYVRSEKNKLVPLAEILKATEKAGPLTINHMNGLPAVSLSFNVPDNVPLSDTLSSLKTLTADLPRSLYGQVVGTAEVYASSLSSLNILFILAFFVIYMILGILYESFIHPLTVMSALPPTLLGGLFTLFLFRESLTIYSFVGLILLMGIVLKNGIMMIDFAVDAAQAGKSAYDAIINACLIRFRPILMTTIAALMGAVPIALGIGGAMAQSRIGLGLCVVGGLLFSQLLTLLLTPVLYYYFETLQQKLSRKQ